MNEYVCYITSTLPSSFHSLITNEPVHCPKEHTRSIDQLQISSSSMESTDHPDRELSSLNRRFSDYLQKIKTLVHINADLHRQVENAYRKYIGHSQSETYFQLNQLRDKINAEVRAQTLIQIRCQRADYDRQFYLNALKTFPSDRQNEIQSMDEQLKIRRDELERLRQQCQRKEDDVQMNKQLYEETLKKLLEFTKQYDQILFERIDNEHQLYTLKEKISFEKEYHQQRHDELEQLDQIQQNLFKQFKLNEYQQIIERIREDYREFNAIRQSELENLYKTKLERLRRNFENEPKTAKPKDFLHALNSSKKEHQTLIEENQTLKSKLEQLERNRRELIEKHRENYDEMTREYRQLERDIPSLDCLLVTLRENAVSLCSEIHTYRYLLVHLLSTPPAAAATKDVVKEKKSKREYRDDRTGLTVHIEDGLIWVRI